MNARSVVIPRKPRPKTRAGYLPVIFCFAAMVNTGCAAAGDACHTNDNCPHDQVCVSSSCEWPTPVLRIELEIESGDEYIVNSEGDDQGDGEKHHQTEDETFRVVEGDADRRGDAGPGADSPDGLADAGPADDGGPDDGGQTDDAGAAPIAEPEPNPEPEPVPEPEPILEPEPTPTCGAVPAAPAGECPAACTGGCDDGTCRIDCDGIGACADAVLHCPDGYACEVECTSIRSCEDAVIECPADAPCDVLCDGINSCDGTSVGCGAEACTVSIDENDDYPWTQDCGDSCGCHTETF